MAFPITAVLFDIGGVVVRSPLLAIEAYETKNKIPLGYINWNIYHGGPNSAWKRLERNEIRMDDTFFEGFQAELNEPNMWARYHGEKGLMPPPVPQIDGKWLFWDMMRVSREYNPSIVNAIEKLRRIGKYKIGALTNNYVFPEDHPYRDDGSTKALFDIYIASVEVGMRKPEHRIFEYAIRAMGVENPSQIVFLDDLGGNLRAAREMGLRTIKVPLHDTENAVRQLEDMLGEDLSLSPSSKL
ncbi:uncharacterized protein DFL_009589 [Arthrobotrys flagrans]|uniref:Epoxide hydrolase n=1 Tax=Arthrobotrys flagrans TaxID=97331 RepID=A0A436ZS32_ARTFL|nr:hypothetical protein DFL_009589 [Arthrobotrys flagrans]